MKIAQIAPLMESVPPRLYGGTERIVSYLTDELVRLGHDVTLFASADSVTAAELVSCAAMALRIDSNVRDPIPYYMLMLDANSRKNLTFYISISTSSRGSFLSDKAISVILIYRTMLPPAYLSKKLIPPLPTKDGGMLRTIREACEYMAAIGKQRELRRHWQHVRKLILEEADVVAVSWQLRLAVLKDAKLDVAADQAIDKEAEAQARS